ncbi:hypothetical protein D3C87_1792540 [compost metagenome]
MKKPRLRMTSPSSTNRTVPIGMSRLRVMMEPRISNPPEEPPARREKPTPPAMMTPPKILARIGSLVSLISGITVRNQVVATTDSRL